jgi:adenylosuccinate lyase
MKEIFRIQVLRETLALMLILQLILHLVRLTNILDNMIVYPKKMLENLNITKGLIFSQEVMLELTKSGLSREQSYKMVQNYAKKCFADNLDLFDVI